MSFSRIAQIVQELAFANIKLYPENYPISDNQNDYNKEASENVETLADSYWENRTEGEVEIDKKAGVTQRDYLNFCLDALNEYSDEIKESVDTSEYQEN